jgi:photosystem II stability/assembly factor-like uncharacterized protein
MRNRFIRLLKSCPVLAMAMSFAHGQSTSRRSDDETNLSSQAQATFDSMAFRGLEWRNIGPFRGGRATTAVGVPSNPLIYYMGATGGGVWKTEDAGVTWKNISDGYFNVGSIGDIAVYQDDPNVVYIGTGEAPVRGQASSYGDGVYKSTDAGRTWTHVGLEKTRTISKVVVHPHNENLVYVAAQGTRWAATDDRGVYRSADGGVTWKRILFVDQHAGPSDLAMDPSNPRILYAAFWDHQRAPWQLRSGGPHSGIWKTTDGGDHWVQLSSGLPKGIMGKICIVVSPANASRVYAVIEAEDGGMYRSDDAGETWSRTSADRALATRPWYYNKVTADPKSPDVVYVMNYEIFKSLDGGRTFDVVPVAHGDTHSLWINPSNPQNLIHTADGGAAISFNGGGTWSTLDNQPTAQFYRVQVDDLFPYQLYGGQQDNTPVVIPSRTFGAGITRADWRIPAGGETSSFAFDPKDPQLVFGTNYLGVLEEIDMRSGRKRNAQAWPALGFGEPSNLQKYRFNWSTPLTVSPFDPHVMYDGANVLFRSSDQGNSWTAISPDLTRNDKAHQGLMSVPFWNDGAGGEVYNTIFYVVESSHERGTIWVGTDDGLVQLTRDDGKTWTNVTPKGLLEGQVNAIEVSPHDRATAYVAFTRFKFNDNTPHLFKTTDYGRSWTDIASGLPQEYPARVVREDPARRDLLYAGTETGVWMSFDGGQRWQPLQRNLPHVPVTDLKIHDGDLVASTEGRAFWILDDLTSIEQMSDATIKSDVFLFKPRPAPRVSGGANASPNEQREAGKNPPLGATIRYWLRTRPDSARRLQLQVVDSAGAVVRTFSSSSESAPERRGAGGRAQAVPEDRGLNQFMWDLRSDAPARVAGLPGEAGNGYLLPSGRYTVRLTLGGETLTQPLIIMPDPRELSSAGDEQQHVILAKALTNMLNDVHRAANDIRSVREQAGALSTRASGSTDPRALIVAVQSLTTKIDSIDDRLVQAKFKVPRSQDGINFRSSFGSQINYLQGAVDAGFGPVTKGERDRAAELDSEWAMWRTKVDALLSRDVPALNALAKQLALPMIRTSETPKPAVQP